MGNHGNPRTETCPVVLSYAPGHAVVHEPEYASMRCMGGRVPKGVYTMEGTLPGTLPPWVPTLYSPISLISQNCMISQNQQELQELQVYGIPLGECKLGYQNPRIMEKPQESTRNRRNPIESTLE